MALAPATGLALAEAERLQGYASATSVAPGQTIHFHVSDPLGTLTTDRSVAVAFYRVGLTEGTAAATGTALVRQQPIPATAWEVGCNWPSSYALVVPSTWSSGLYYTTFGTGEEATQIYFVVRALQPGSSSKILYQVPFTTPQAYNNWGGKSLYDFNSCPNPDPDGFCRPEGVRAAKVSFNRPMKGLYDRSDLWHRSFIRWLERNNIAVEYASNVDLHADAALLSPYQLVAIVGHDEYWSRPMRDHLDAFRYWGGNVGIFSGNTAWWQVRLEPDAVGVPNRTLVCYKYVSAESGASADPVADASLRTIHWFDPQVGHPENSTTGLSFRHGAIFGGPGRPLTPFKVFQAEHWVYANTGLRNADTFGGDIVGIETDTLDCSTCTSSGRPRADGTDGSPFNFQILGFANATAWLPPGHQPGYGALGLFDYNGTVFNAGTTDWAYGLDTDIPGQATTTVGTITRNVLGSLSRAKTPLQAATLAVYQYHALQADGVRRFYFATSPFVTFGWLFDDLAFYSLQTPQTGTVPVFQYHRVLTDGGWEHYFSTDANVLDGWINDGTVFHAYPAPGSGRVAVYQYHAVQADGHQKFFLSRDSNLGGGWILDGTAFHAPAVGGLPAGPDRIFASEFEGGSLSEWSARATGGGDLSVAPEAALAGTTLGLKAVVNDTAALMVEDDSPNDEGRYRARFYFDPNGFDPGVASGNTEVNLFFAAEELPVLRLVTVVLQKSSASGYKLVARVRLDDGSQREAGPFNVADAPHVVEFDWRKASAPGASDGIFRLWIDPSSAPPAATARLTGLNNGGHSVDFVRLGAIGVKPGASGTLYFDGFVSRRQTFIGP